MLRFEYVQAVERATERGPLSGGPAFIQKRLDDLIGGTNVSTTLLLVFSPRRFTSSADSDVARQILDYANLGGTVLFVCCGDQGAEAANLIYKSLCRFLELEATGSKKGSSQAKRIRAVLEPPRSPRSPAALFGQVGIVCRLNAAFPELDDVQILRTAIAKVEQAWIVFDAHVGLDPAMAPIDGHLVDNPEAFKQIVYEWTSTKPDGTTLKIMPVLLSEEGE